MSNLHIRYRTAVERPRTGPAGRLLRFLADHPVRAGLLCGGLVVAIAVVRASGGVANEPLFALVLSLIVVVTWTVLFYFMRPFFRQQTRVRVDVSREIVMTDDELMWKEDGQVRRVVPAPRVEAFSNPVPEAMLESPSQRDLPWPVWLVFTGGDEQIVVETRITAREASGYPPVDPDVLTRTDETIPVQIASPLLMLVRRRREPSDEPA